MRIESERIKKVMKEVCQTEGDTGPYNLMCKILEYLQSHDNMPTDLRNENVKDIIDEEEDSNNENSQA